MPNPLLLDICLFFAANGIVQGDGIDCFRDFLPESPDDCVLLYEYAGDPCLPYESAVHRSVQILARSGEADLARQLAQRLYKALVDTQETNGKVVLTPDRWGQVFIRQTPMRIGTDGNNRTKYAFNIGITTTYY